MRRSVGSILVAATFLACSDDTSPVCEATGEKGECAPATEVVMDFEGAGFFDSPFPSDARRGADGRPVIEGFPNPQSIVLVDRVLAVLRSDAQGFGVSSGAFFRTTAALDPETLPTLEGSLEEGSSVFLIGVDPDAEDYLKRYPVKVAFTADGGLYGAPNLLSLVPLQGIPLRSNARYAAVVTNAVHDEGGGPLAPSSAMTSIASGTAPAGMSDEAFALYGGALDSLVESGVDADGIAALTVFTTDDPTRMMADAVEASLAQTPPEPNEAFAKTDDFDGFCVYQATIDMPDYQSGEPPFLEEGGNWVSDGAGGLVLQRSARAKFVVTIPKTEMPPAGYPMVVFSRTGGGGDRPLVDRGVRAEPGGEAIEPGTGPARELALAGFAGASVDGPHGGLRNITEADEQFLVFNFQNPLALRDNVRQSALELALMPSILEGVSIDVSDCAGAVAEGGIARIDTETMVIMGHSMGAAIAPLAIVYEPRYRAMLLSGAGGSFLENMMYKEKPLAVKPLAELILGMTIAGYELTEHDPMLSMLQWAGEPADNPIYGRHVIREPVTGGPRHVLMMQGIVDHYIMPPIANATSLSFGLDLAGEALDGEPEELASLTPLEELLQFSGGSRIELPAAGNIALGSDTGGETVTAVVTQNPEDGIEDGHEVMFQTEGPKHAYTCFLRSLAPARGAEPATPRVPAPGSTSEPCE